MAHLLLLERDVDRRPLVDQLQLDHEVVAPEEGGVVHDSNNALSIILGYCDILRTLPEDQLLPEPARYVETIATVRAMWSKGYGERRGLGS